MGDMRNAYKILFPKPKGTTLETRHMWEYNMKAYHKKQDMRIWTGFILLRIQFSSRLLLTG
jgi:hypothetical protein